MIANLRNVFCTQVEVGDLEKWNRALIIFIADILSLNRLDVSLYLSA